MTVTKVGGANMIAHAQWPQSPPFPRVAVFYVTAAPGHTKSPPAQLKDLIRATYMTGPKSLKWIQRRPPV